MNLSKEDQAALDRHNLVQSVFDARNVNAEVHDCLEAGCTITPQGLPATPGTSQKRPPLDPTIVLLEQQLGV